MKNNNYSRTISSLRSMIIICLLAITGMWTTNVNAQTTLINPAGDGGFSNGTTFAANGWTVSNYVSSVNAWVCGTAISTAPFAGRSAYISIDGGTTNTYNVASAGESYIYRDITIPAGQSVLTLTFNWNGFGESAFDMIQVFTAPTTVTPVGEAYPGSGVAVIPIGLTGATWRGSFQLVSTIQTATLIFTGTPGTTMRIIFAWKSDTSLGTQPAGSVDNISLVSSATFPSFTATAIGGLWSSPATWVGGVVPPGGDVVIPSGSIVTVDQVTSINNLDISGILQWNGTANAMTLSGNVTVNAGGSFLPYTTAAGGTTGISVTVGGNFTNNGYANFAVGTTTNAAIIFNGPSAILSGTGTFQGDGTRGIIRALLFGCLGSNSISTTQPLTTYVFAHSAGSLNTNGLLKIDNTAQVYGTALNTQVASVNMTAMGTLYNAAPTVFGTATSLWTSGGAATANIRYASAGNVYLCTTAGTFGGSAPVNTTPVTETNGTATVLWIGTTGTLGNPFQVTLTTLGTQYFCGGNLYTCIVAGTPTAGTAPTCTGAGSTCVSGTATFRYAGSPAVVSVNYDATTQTVRSLSLTSGGSGYSSSTAPTLVFSLGIVGGTGSGAAATPVILYNLTGTANSLAQKSGVATISSGLIINSDQGASVASADPQASSGVGNISTTSGGVNYTVAPQIAFGGPLALNLVTNPGSGYAVAPTINVSGGTLIAGVAYTSANFLITVNQGTVQSVYLNTTAAVYSVPPTLTFSAGTATLAFPAGCWPAATANIGTNGQLTSFTMTNAGYGYAAAPLVALGTIVPFNGTFTTAATTPTARIALYNLTLNFFIPATSAVVNPDDAIIPSNRKMNNLSLAGNGNGLNLSNNLTLFGTAPLTLTASLSSPGNILNLGGNNLNFTWNGYAGATNSTFNSGGTNCYVKNGSITLTGRGGAGTFNYPFAGNVTTGSLVWFVGSTPTAVTTGCNALKYTVTELGAPTNAIVGTGGAIGNRSYRAQFNAGALAGTNPTITLHFNSLDGLTVTQDQLFVADANAQSGPWTIRSTAFGVSGALPATGSKITATVAPGPIVSTGDNYYAFAVPAPVVSSFAPGTVCANSGSFIITGSGFTGTTAVSVGGNPVSSFVVNNSLQITAIAGNGPGGVVSVTANGFTGSSAGSLIINPSPAAPTVTPPSASITPGQTAAFIASGSEVNFAWYDAPTGGTLLASTAGFTTPVLCVTTTYYVEQNNGSCAGARTPVVVTVPVESVSTIPANALICSTGGTVDLQASVVSGNTYLWSTSQTTSTITVGPSVTTPYALLITNNGCTYNLTVNVGVIAGSAVTPTANPTSTCFPGGASTITLNSNLSSSGFGVSPITFAPASLPGSGVTTLATGGAAVVPLSGGSLDDGGWGGIPLGFNYNFFGSNFNNLGVGTNGLVMFGPIPGYGTGTGQLGQFTFVGPPFFPNAGNPGNVIGLMLSDMNFGTATSSLQYWTDGIAPTRRFVLSGVYAQFSGGALTTVQLMLYETTGIVEVHITSSAATIARTVGLQDATKTIGAVAPGWSGRTTTLTTPEAWRFSPPANYTYLWSNAATTSTTSHSVVAAGNFTYTLSVTNPTTSCITDATVSFNVFATPAAPTISGNLNVCGLATTTLTSNAPAVGNTMDWYDAPIGGLLVNTGTSFTTPSLTASITYYVQETSPACNSTRTPVTVAWTAPPALAIYNTTNNNTNDVAFCGTVGVPVVNLDANFASSSLWSAHGSSYSWSQSHPGGLSCAGTCSGTNSVNLNNILPTFNNEHLIVTVTDPVSGCIAASSVNVTAFTFPSFNATATPSTICSGQSTQISAGVSASNFAVSSIAYAGMAAPGSGVTTLCDAGTIVTPMTISSLDDGIWGTQPIGFNFNFFGNTYSTVNISTNGNLQFTSQLTTFTPGALPTTIITNFVAPFWTDLYPALPATAGFGIIRTWVSGFSPNRIFVVEYNNVGHYNLGSTPTAYFTGQVWLYETTGVVEVHIGSITGNGSPNTYLWSTGVNNSTGTIGAAAPNRNLDESGANLNTTNESWRFSPPVTYTFAWTSIPAGFTSTSGTPTASPTVNTQYNVVVTDPITGCTKTDQVSVVVNPLPAVNVSPTTSSVCSPGGPASVLTASGDPATYTWSPTAGLSPTTGSPVNALPSSTTTYTVTALSAAGCTSTASTTVNVIQGPVVSATATPPAFCPGGSTQLLATATLPGYTMNSNCSTGFVDISTTGTAVLTGGAIDDLEANVTLPFSFNFNGVSYTTARVGNNGVLVFGSSAGEIDLTNACLPVATFGTSGTPGIAAFWDDLDDQDATTAVLTQQIGSVFYVEWFNEAHFSGPNTTTATFEIQLEQTTNKITLSYSTVNFGNVAYDGGVNATVGLNFSAASALQYSCNSASLTAGQCISFTPVTPSVTYDWSANANFLSATNIANPMANAVTSSQTYSVTVTDGSTNCATTQTVAVTVYPPPVPTANNSSPVCEGFAMQLFGGNSAAGQAPNTFSWTGPGYGPVIGQNPVRSSIPLSGSGNYTVTVTNSNGCTATASTLVIVNPNPVLSVTSVTNEVCVGAQDGCIDVDATNGTPSYLYDLNGNSTLDGNYCGLGAGIYTVTVIDDNSCESSINVTVIQEDNVDPTIVCPPNVIVHTNPGVCYATNVNLGNPVYADNCGGLLGIANNAPVQYPQGGVIVQWEVTDLEGNKASCNQTVAIQDLEPPVALCKNICVYLGSNGLATITGADIDNGSHDNCGIASLTASPSSFSYADAGPNTVTLTVFDVNGNSSTCTATVTVGEYYTLFGADNNCSTPSGQPDNCHVQIGNGNNITGNVGSYRLITTGGGVAINGNVWSGGKVNFANGVSSKSVSAANLLGLPGLIFQTGNSADITGDVNVQGNININQNAGSFVTGTVRHPAGTTYAGPLPGGGVLTAPPVLPALPGMPAIHAYSCGGANITTTATLVPGSYGNITLGNPAGVVITFSGPGNYYFSRISMGQGGIHTFKYDFMGLPGKINIYVCGDIDFGDYEALWANPNTPDACRVYFETHGTGSTNGTNSVMSAIIALGSHFYGRVWAPYGGIHIGSGSCCTYATGSFWSAKQVQLEGAVTISRCGSTCPPAPKIGDEISSTDNIKDMLQVYPNPTRGQATVSFFTETPDNYSLKVMDYQGRVILSNEIKSIAGDNTFDIDMSQFAKGLYLIEVGNNDHSKKVKLVVQ